MESIDVYYDALSRLEKKLLKKYRPNIVTAMVGTLRRTLREFVGEIDALLIDLTEHILPSLHDEYLKFEKQNIQLRDKYSLYERIVLFLDEYSKRKTFLDMLQKRKYRDRDIFANVFDFLISNMSSYDVDSMFEMDKIVREITIGLIVALLVDRLMKQIIREKTIHLMSKISLKHLAKKHPMI